MAGCPICRKKIKGLLIATEVLDETCAICFEPLKNPVKIRCKHTFCYKCIDQWISQKDKITIIFPMIDETSIMSFVTTSAMPPVIGETDDMTDSISIVAQ